MYDLYIGNYERVMGMTVYHKIKDEYIPCKITCHSSNGKYTLVPVDDFKNNVFNRRIFYTTKVYVRVEE